MYGTFWPSVPPKATPRRPAAKPKPPKDTPEDHEQANLTDADSRLMGKSKRSSYEQTYNSQATVDADGSQLILGGHVSTCASDANELVPAVGNIPEEVGNVSAVLAAVANHYGYVGMGWREGDFNNDGVVKVYDLAALANHYGCDYTGGGVPEPATLALLALGGCLSARRRRR